MRIDFGVGDEVTYRDLPWRIESISLIAIGLVDRASGDRVTVDRLALEDENPTESRVPREFTWLDTNDVGLDLTADELRIGLKVIEVIEAASDAHQELSAPGEPKYSKAERAARARAELSTKHGIEIAASTWRSYEKRCREGAGVACARDGRRADTAKVIDRASPALIEVCRAFLEKQRTRSTMNVNAQVAEVEHAFFIAHPDRADELLPTRVLGRLLVELGGAFQPAIEAKTRLNTTTKGWMLGSTVPVGPGWEVQADSTRMDCLVRLDDDRVVRPNLTILQDKFSRSIVGFGIKETNRAIDVVLMAAGHMLPIVRRREMYSHLDYDRLRDLNLDWLCEIDGPTDWMHDVRRNAIRISRVVTDNALDFVGGPVTAGFHYLGIMHAPVSMGTGSDKGMVEANLGSISTLFLQHLNGYTGRNTAHRGRHPERDSVLDLDELVYLFDAWVTIVWQNRRHEGLTDPYYPRAAPMSPNLALASALPFTGSLPKSITFDDYVRLLVAEGRVVTAMGIEFDSRRYDCEALNPLRPVARERKGANVRIRFHPDFKGCIWVIHPDSGELIRCDLVDPRRQAPFTRNFRDTYRALASDYSTLGDAEARRWTVVMKEAANAEHAKRNKEERRKARALELEAAHGRVRVDDAHVQAIGAPDRPNEEPGVDREVSTDDFVPFDMPYGIDWEEDE
ncbi:Mu transposase C-terminal domain-containing protein [Demequina globuliformis]|uniref:Mu transposase C-terminal domain-containing protein n=1 Tax=Demequina globuliformis TaxID=676202 RepID=UPI000B0BFDCC|nr:Mu transposase C-terminal domain-containing protein [Demequina globuliformis]